MLSLDKVLLDLLYLKKTRLLVAIYLRCVDDEEAGAPPSDEEHVERATKFNCRPVCLKLSVRAAVAAKKRFGLLSDTTANRDLISDYVQQGWGQQQKLSDAVVVNIYPTAVAFALIPSEQDIEASHERARLGFGSDLGRADIQTEKLLCCTAITRPEIEDCCCLDLVHHIQDICFLAMQQQNTERARRHLEYKWSRWRVHDFSV